MAKFVLDPVEKIGARVRIQNIRFDGRHPQLIRSRGERCPIAARNCNASLRQRTAVPSQGRSRYFRP